MPELKGINIKEVWDYRLSTAIPTIYRLETWVVAINAKSNPDYDPEKPESIAVPLEVFDTKIPVVKDDTYDVKKVKVCFEWLLSVRDKYARDDIEEIKPIVAKINELNAKLAAKGAAK